MPRLVENSQTQPPLEEKSKQASSSSEGGVAAKKVDKSQTQPPLEEKSKKASSSSEGGVAAKKVDKSQTQPPLEEKSKKASSSSEGGVAAMKVEKSQKRTLLERKNDGDSPECPAKKKPRKGQESTSDSQGADFETPTKSAQPDNKKRSHCEICTRPRAALQRGAACPTCLKTLRDSLGHQSLSSIRGDASTLAKIREASLKTQDKDEQERATPVEKRLSRVEDMLGKIMKHLKIS